MLLILTEGYSLFGICEADKSGFEFFGTSRELFCIMKELLDLFVVVPWFLIVAQCFPNCGLQLQGGHKSFNKNHLATKKKVNLAFGSGDDKNKVQVAAQRRVKTKGCDVHTLLSLGETALTNKLTLDMRDSHS